MTDLTDLEGFYDSYEVDLNEKFYIPLFRMARRVDRVSCYFSSKALALYSRGLEEFAKEPGSKYRLIISEEVSEEDFEAIQKGESERYDDILSSRLRETLSLSQENALGTLVKLMATGVVEFRIALVKRGIFHSKWAFVEGLAGERMLMLGSNNETAAAIEDNYEEFDFRQCRLNDRHEDKFEQIWNGDKPGIIIKKPSELIWAELKKYQKEGHLVIDEHTFTPDCIYLKWSGDNIILENRLIDSPSNYNIVYGAHIKLYVKSYTDRIVFKENANYTDCRNIITNLSDYCSRKNVQLVVSKTLEDMIRNQDLMLDKRRKLGLLIKAHSPNIVPQFSKFKEVVDSATSRKLYDQQMWDAFFMYSMKKAGNFSVPGSGKTSSVLGVLAFVREKENVRNLLVICPLNAFDSWIFEYTATFGHNPSTLDVRTYNNSSAARAAIHKDYYSSDLILINYQSLFKYADIIEKHIANSLLIFDEGHYVKGWGNQRTKAALTVSHDAPRTLILTGTPMPNSYSDLYSILNIMFPKEYGSYFRYSLSTLSNPSNNVINDINERIKPFYCRTSKDDLKVPPANPDIILSYDSSPDEHKLYESLLGLCDLNPLVAIVRILQAESDPSMLMVDDVQEDVIDSFKELVDDVEHHDGTTPLMPSLRHLSEIVNGIGTTTKTRMCVSEVEKLVSERKTVIIWCIFKKSISNLRELIRARGIGCESIDGSVQVSERSSIISKFKSGVFPVLITNPHTLAESVSLHQVCHDTIYFEYSYNLVHLLQSKDRIHRLGLKDNQYTQHRFMSIHYPKMVLDFIDSPSLDDAIYNRLKEKEATMMEAITAGTLESSISSPEKDLEDIFLRMGWQFPERKTGLNQ